MPPSLPRLNAFPCWQEKQRIALHLVEADGLHGSKGTVLRPCKDDSKIYAMSWLKTTIVAVFLEKRITVCAIPPNVANKENI